MHHHGQSFYAKLASAWDLASIWQVLVSVLLHGLLLLVFYLLPQAQPPEPLEEQEIEVEIIPLSALLPPPPAPISSEPSTQPLPALPSQAKDKVSKDKMVRPSRMLSGSVLAQKNNALARRALREIPADERREQLCTLEAMEQLAAWDPQRQPDLVLSYIFKETRWEAQTLYADGAAMMSKGQWYYLSYECILADEERKVSDFAFKLGGSVPRRLWDGYDLIDQVHDTAKGIENYNKKTRGE